MLSGLSMFSLVFDCFICWLCHSSGFRPSRWNLTRNRRPCAIWLLLLSPIRSLTPPSPATSRANLQTNWGSQTGLRRFSHVRSSYWKAPLSSRTLLIALGAASTSNPLAFIPLPHAKSPLGSRLHTSIQAQHHSVMKLWTGLAISPPRSPATW